MSAPEQHAPPLATPWVPLWPLSVAPSVARIFDSTLGAAAPSFDVTGIPGTYSQLRWALTGRGTVGANEVEVRLRMNNDSGGTLYEWQRTYAHSGGASNGAQGGSGATSLYLVELPGAGAAAGRAGTVNGEIHNYASTTLQKIVNASGGRVAHLHLWESVVGSWLSAAAIDRLTFFPASGDFAAGTRLTVWGYA